MFEALGWRTLNGKSVRLGERETTQVVHDLVVRYGDLSIPVEVKKLRDLLDVEADNQLFQSVRIANSSWGILTNFETIRIWDFRDPNQPVVALETTPWSYIADGAEDHDLLAAEIFYQRLVQPGSEVPATEEALPVQVEERPEVRDRPDVEIEEEQAARIEERRSTRIEIAIRALSDQPSEVDLLGFSDYAQALADFIKNEKTEKPLTIGIDAAWGMGKTTLMRMIRYQLTEQEQEAKRDQSFRTVWFNAWKYDEEESLWAALVLEILAQVRKTLSWRRRLWLWIKLNWKRFDRGRLWQKILKYLIIYVFLICILGTLAFGVASLWLGATWQESWQQLKEYVELLGALGVLTAIYAAGKQVFESLTGPFDLKISEYVREPDYQERIGFLGQLEEDFKRVINVVTQKGKWPLVVFIDDLDRCAPPKPAEIIEAINILLDAKHCVFVIGMDAATVAGSIEAKYEDLKGYLDDRDDPGGLTLGQRFLEKIIQISFRIPRVDPDLVETFINKNLGVPEEEPTTEPSREEVAEAEQLIKAEQRAGKSLDEAGEAVQVARPNMPREVVAEAKRGVFAKSFDDSEEVRKAIHEAAPYLGLNPRKIKRFINIFRLQALIANRRGLLEAGTIQLGLLAKWVIIATRWPDMIEAVTTDQNFTNSLKQAHEMQEQLRLASGEIQEMIQADLNALLADPRIKRLIEATDLIRLLDNMTNSEIEAMPYYLYLAQTTSERSQPSSDGRVAS